MLERPKLAAAVFGALIAVLAGTLAFTVHSRLAAEDEETSVAASAPAKGESSRGRWRAWLSGGRN